MVKILQVCPKYFPDIGGVETHVKEISERLVERGFDVEVCTTSALDGFQAEEIINGVKVRRFKSLAPGDAYFFSRPLKQYLTKNSEMYDVVHAHNYHAFPALYAAQAKGKKMLIFTSHYHGAGHSFLRKLLFKPYKLMGKTIFEKADKVICVSNYEKNIIIKDHNLSEDKIVVIPNGVNLKEFKGLKKEPKKTRTILFVGRLEKYKGIAYLILAMPLLDIDISLEIVGKGAYQGSLLRLVEKLGVNGRVHFYHDLPRNEIIQKYANADLFALLSSNEAFSVSVAEALSSKTPCIVANTSALKEWVDNKNCLGIDYPIRSGNLVDVINRAFENHVDVLKVLDWNEVVDKLISVYK